MTNTEQQILRIKAYWFNKIECEVNKPVELNKKPPNKVKIIKKLIIKCNKQIENASKIPNI